MNTLMEEPPTTSLTFLTWKETTDLFQEAAKDTSVLQAYQAFNSCHLCQSLWIPDDIWHALEPVMKEKIDAIRRTIR